MQKYIEQIILTNFKKHSKLALTISGKSFILSGGNGAGKSSVFQAIDHMVAQASLPDNPVTDGEEDGEIELIMAASGATYKVRRRFTKTGMSRYELRRDAGNGRFDVLNPAVERFKEIFGNCIDLTPLIDLDGAAQIEFLQTIIGSDEDYQKAIKENEERIKLLTEERLLVGRAKRDAEAKLLVPEFRALVNYLNEELEDLDTIEERFIETSVLHKELANSTLVNNTAEHYISVLSSIKTKDEEINQSLQSLIEKFEAKKVDVAKLTAEIMEAEAHNAEVEKELRAAELRNQKIVQAQDLKATQDLIVELNTEYNNLTQRIREAAGMVGRSIARCEFGEIYEGLEMRYVVNDDGKPVEQGLFLRGLPFNRRQQSYGEMVKVLVIMSKSLNPDGFNYVNIGYWNELDEENQNMVIELAQSYGIQLGIEKVDDGKELSLQLIER